MWKQTIPTTMQGFGNYCGQMQINQVLTLKDTRDNNSYTVAKLKDGKCWMTQNLRIQNYTLTSKDSDVSSDFILPSSQFGAFCSGNTKSEVYIDSMYGGYYNSYTSVAGRIVSSGDAQSSICPKGWKLPPQSIYEGLIAQYTYQQLLSGPINFLQGENNACGSWGTAPPGRSFAYTSTYCGGSCVVRFDSGRLETASDPNLGMNVRCISNN